MQQMDVRAVCLGMGAVILLTGCTGRPSRIRPPAYNAAAGAVAIATYDTDGDGMLGGAELDRVPALRAALAHVDADGDGRLTAQEIDARVAAWQASRIAEMYVGCEVTWDGEPLSDAQVVFEPEPFLGPQVMGAQGTSVDGMAGMSMPKEALADPRYPGVAPGWYKIRVISASRPIPPRYNTETTLGCEVAMEAHWSGHGAVEVKLLSR